MRTIIKSPGKMVFVMLAMIMASLTVGCEIFKTRSERKEENSAVKKNELNLSDSSSGGGVRKENINSNEKSEFERWIMQYGRPSGDTNIYNINTYPQQPATIVYERGTTNRDETRTTLDSSYYVSISRMMAMAFDSLNNKIDQLEKTKHVEAKGIGLMTAVIVAIGAVVLFKGLGFISSKYSLTKK